MDIVKDTTALYILRAYLLLWSFKEAFNSTCLSRSAFKFSITLLYKFKKEEQLELI